jgi:hypothetical protein
MAAHTFVRSDDAGSSIGCADRAPASLNLGPNFGPNSAEFVETRCNEQLGDFAKMLGNIDYSERGETSRNNV